MFSQIHFVVIAGWVSIGIVGLSWVLACAVTANKMEREGITFWKAFVACVVLTPLVGLVAIGVARSMRPSRPLIQTVTRG